MTQRALLDRLDAAGVRYELIPPDDADLGNALAAKRVLLATHRGLVQAIVPASRRVDVEKAREFLGTKYVELVRDGAAGTLPYLDQLLVDGRVCDRAFAVIQGAETEDSVRVKTSDLVKLTGALLVDLCHDVGPAAAFRH